MSPSATLPQNPSISWIAKVKVATGKTLDEAVRAERRPDHFDRNLVVENALYFPDPKNPHDYSSVYTDITQLLHRLLLSDQFTLRSYQLFEMPAMLRVFGVGGTIELLKSGAVRLMADWFTIAHLRRARKFSHCFDRVHLPQTPFIQHSREAFLRSLVSSPAKANRLIRAVFENLMPLPAAELEGTGEPRGAWLRREILKNPAPFVLGTAHFLSDYLQRSVSPADFSLVFHEETDVVLHAETNIEDRLGVDSEIADEAVIRGGLAVGEMLANLELMKHAKAIGDLTPRQLELCEERYTFLFKLSSTPDAHDLHRVLSIANRPALLKVAPGDTVDVYRLLELRESPGWHAFRQWLLTSRALNSADIERQLVGWRPTLSRISQSDAGRTIRWVITELAGLVPVLGTAVSALDAFVVDRLMSNAGPAAFVNEIDSVIAKGP
jgi:hypothetical protein